MNETLKIVLSLSLSGALLILILCLLRPLFKERLSKRWQYYIWLVVIVRLLLPFAPETNLMGTFFQAADRAIEQTELSPPLAQQGGMVDIPPSGDIIDGQGNLHSEPSEPTGSVNNPMWNILFRIWKNLWIGWLVVALILFIRKITIYQSFVKYIRAGCVEVADIDLLELFGKLVERSKVKITVELHTNNLISSPLMIGFFKPCIVLPTTDLSATNFEYTILHELTHYKRRDMFYKWLVQLTVCVHWFNPLVYLMSREVNRVCELSCDEVVIRTLDLQGRRAYGDTLINAMSASGSYKNSLASVTLGESKALLKKRLDAIMSYKKKSKIIVFVSMAVVLLLLCGATCFGAYSSKSVPNASMMDEEKSQTPLGTKADYQSLLALKTSDYKNQTVAEFNNSLLEWATKNQDGANVRVLENDVAVHQFPEYLNAEEQSFLSLTVTASIHENSVQTRNYYGKPMIDPDLSFELSKQDTEVDPPIWTQLMYGFSYHFDVNKLTVGERDSALAKVIDEVQNFWNSTDIEVLASMTSDDMFDQLKKIVETCSTETVKMSVMENYFMFQTSKMIE